MAQMHLLIILGVTAPVLSQYYMPTGMRADITFGKQNARFDLTDLIKQQHKQDMDYGADRVDYDDDAQDGRRRAYSGNHFNYDFMQNTGAIRNSKKHKAKLRKARLNHINDLANQIIRHNIMNRDQQLQKARRSNAEVFAYHDNMNVDDEAGLNEHINKLGFDENNGGSNFERAFQRRMKNYVNKLHGVSKTRRVADPVREVLFHHAFPMDIKKNGYFQMPVK